MLGNKKLLFGVIVIILFTSGVYLNSLNNPFHFDDNHSILMNSHIRDLGNIPDFFTNPQTFSGHTGTRMYRPVLLATYAFNYAIGEYNPIGYHIVNILLHILNTLLIYFILLFLLSAYYPASEHEEKDLILDTGNLRLRTAFMASLLFGVHTLNTQAVNYISSRSVLLATFFYLLSFYLYIRFSRGKGQGARGTYYALSLLSFTLSLLSKEIAITLPLTLLLYDYLFNKTSTEARAGGGDECRLGGRHNKWHMGTVAAESRGAASTVSGADPVPRNRSQSEPKDSIGQTHRSAPTTYSLLSTLYYRLRYHLPYWVITAGYFLLRKSLMGRATIDLSVRAFTEGTGTKRGIFINLLTQAKANLFYIKSLFLPTGLSVEHYMEVAKGIGEPDVIFSVTVILLLITSAFILGKRYWGMSFGILWFFITTMPESVVPLNVIISEHRAYLPMVGFAIFCGFLFDRIKEWFYVGANLCVRPYWAGQAPPLPQGRHTGLPLLSTILLPTIYFLIALFILLNAFGTISRNQVWQDEHTLWKDAAEKYPGRLVRAHTLIGVAYEQQGLLFEAMREYETAININPKYPEAHDHMGSIYFKLGLLDKAVEEYKIAIKLRPSFAEAHNNLGAAYHKMGMFDKAIEHYKTALKGRPAYEMALRNLNRAYAELSARKDKPHPPK